MGMTLARRMTLLTAALVVGVLILAAAMLWGLRGLRQDYVATMREYQRLRQVYEVGSYIASARDALDDVPPDANRASNQLQSALGKLMVVEQTPLGGTTDPQRDLLWHQSTRELAGVLESSLLRIRAATVVRSAMLMPRPDSLNRGLNLISEFGADLRGRISAIDEADAVRLRVTTLQMLILAISVVFVAASIGVSQYRAAIAPLRRLSSGVRDIAAGRLTRRLEVSGDQEFRALAEDFNRMASELDGLYRSLEQRVADKSRELVQSERLASVGFLAAGVAHEINNPLAIISGHAELTLRRLERAADPAAALEALDTLRVIRDEAFRCKEITQKLLELSRPGEQVWALVSLGKVARDVSTMVRGLTKYRAHELEVQAEADEAVMVLANESEMRQVVLNLTVNALEAVEAATIPGSAAGSPAGSPVGSPNANAMAGGAGNGVATAMEKAKGRVVLSVRRRGGSVELSVEDNGRGMSAETLRHVFEPFFTDKRGAGEPGTGLGLSITHAIVTGHGGRVTAASEGPGRGSRFVVELPAGGGDAAAPAKKAEPSSSRG